MAFLQHPPRRTTRPAEQEQRDAQTHRQRRDASPRGQTDRSDANASFIDSQLSADGRDWSIVFPGRSRHLGEATRSAQQHGIPSSSDASDAASPFSVPDDGDEELELTLPPLHDGTGRFTRPSSPFYAADDEQEAHASPLSLQQPLGPPSDSLTLDSFSDDELDFDAAEVASSALFSESESGTGAVRHANSTISAAQLRRSSRLSHRGSATLASSSWSWMSAAQSQHARPGVVRRLSAQRRESWAVLPVVLTSDSEGEEDEQAAQARRDKDDAAFEEALGSAHFAQSAGLYPRVPKRRHRKNGESEKGSKRSNNSAAVASELLSHRRLGVNGRRSQTSAASVRSRSRLGSAGAYTRKAAGEGGSRPSTDASRSERLLNAILQRVFGVDDYDVLQAFLRDEGPLQVDESEHQAATAAASSSRAPLGVGTDDDVWSRNQRQRHMRLLLDGRSVPEDVEEMDSGREDGKAAKDIHGLSHIDPSHHKPHPYPQRTHVPGNVAEPSLTEALHATVLSGLRVVPSGLSILLAGSNSVRFVNYLVGRIGPGFTERFRKLVDDDAVEEENVSTETNILTRALRSNSTAGTATSGLSSWDDVDVSSLRFKGNKHPAIASSTRSARSNSQSTIPATNT